MSLYKQLVIFICALFVFMFVGTFIVSFKSTQSFLAQQLESQTNDAAGSLSVSVSPFVESYDIPGIQSTVNAIFNTSYYQHIEVLDFDGAVLMSNNQQPVIDKVPGWFMNILQLKAPTASRDVIGGGLILGSVELTAHPDYAYQQLWEVSIRSFMWFLSAAIALILLGNMILRRLLVPLHNVEQQAEAICARNYDVQIPLPKTTELRAVVTAINKMTTKVKTMFDEQSRIANQLQEIAYKDALTGLANQRHFKAQLASHLQESDKFVPGAFYLIQLNDLSGFNNRRGFWDGDKALVRFSDILKQQAKIYPRTLSGRISGGDFALFIANINSIAAESIANHLCEEFAQLYLEELFDKENVASVGMIMLEEMQDLSAVLSSTDKALRAAQAKGANYWQRSQGQLHASNTSSRQSWLKHLAEKVNNADITLLQQNVLQNPQNGEIIHAEIFVQINDEQNKPCSASSFMPAAEQLQLTQKIDRAVIDKLVVYLVNNGLELSPNFAINLSLSSLRDASFLEWIYNSLEKLPTPTKDHNQHSKIVFEFSELVAVNNLEILQDFSDKLNAMGYGIGLDQFGHGRSEFAYLKSLRPEYVKIDSAYTRQLHNNLEKQFFISTLSNICQNLDIRIIAQAVESRELLEMLKSLNIDGVQGYAIHRPEKLNHHMAHMPGLMNYKSTSSGHAQLVI